MAYAAITYRVQPGHEAEINEISAASSGPTAGPA